jgi:hypothetical protein
MVEEPEEVGGGVLGRLSDAVNSVFAGFRVRMRPRASQWGVLACAMCWLVGPIVGFRAEQVGLAAMAACLGAVALCGVIRGSWCYKRRALHVYLGWHIEELITSRQHQQLRSGILRGEFADQ